MQESRIFTILVKQFCKMKIEQIFDNAVDSYGGLHFFHRFIDRSGLSQVVEDVLGKRSAQAEYSYTEVFTSFTANCLAGGTYTEDMNILRSKNHSKTGYKYCSADTFKYVNYQLVDMERMHVKYTQKDKEAEFFYNEPLNRLLLQTYRCRHVAEYGNSNDRCGICIAISGI